MKVCIGMPVVDSIPAESFQTHIRAICEVQRLMIKEGGSITLANPINVFPHDVARSLCTEIAEKENCDFIFWIDDDMILPENCFENLRETLRQSKAQAVSGFYYRRGQPYTPVWTVDGSKVGEYHQVTAGTGKYQIDYSGLGCCLVDLNWVRKNIAKPYYTMGIGELASIVTDDVSFFKKLKEADGVLIGDADIRCGHLGSRMVICDLTVDDLRRQGLQIENAGLSQNENGEVDHSPIKKLLNDFVEQNK